MLSDQENTIVEFKTDRNVKRLGSKYPKYIGVKLLALGSILLYLSVAFVFTYYFANTRVEPLQMLWFYSIIIWFILDLFLFRPFFVLLADVFVPSLVANRLSLISETLVKCIVNLTNLNI